MTACLAVDGGNAVQVLLRHEVGCNAPSACSAQRKGLSTVLQEPANRPPHGLGVAGGNEQAIFSVFDLLWNATNPACNDRLSQRLCLETAYGKFSHHNDGTTIARLARIRSSSWAFGMCPTNSMWGYLS